MTRRLTRGLFLAALVVSGASVSAQQTPPTKAAGALSDAEKLFGLSLIWKDASVNFPSFDRVPKLDWNKAYQDFIPQILAAPNTFEYYRVLQRFIALLKDGHSTVSFPASLREKNPIDLPWIEVVAIQRRAIVSNVEKALAAALPLGSEILTVDGIPVAEYLERHVLPYVASSTEPSLWASGITGDVKSGYGLLAGATGSSVRFTARAPDGSARSLAAARDRGVRRSEWLVPKPPRQLLEFRWLEDSVAYLALNGFTSDSVVQRVDSVLPALVRARAVVLDLRQSVGDSVRIANTALARLTSTRPTDTLTAARATARVSVPIAVLIGRGTVAAAEALVVHVAGDARFTLVGQPTLGRGGQPLVIDLPGGGAALLSKRHGSADGDGTRGTGINPRITVEPTVDDVRAGRDPVLDRAVRIFQRPVPPRPVRR